MHFTGRTWRPPYEAHSVIIQATSGCTYNKCKFCSLYKNTLFCSPKCRTKFYRQEAAEKRKRECVCENCGKTFTATRKDVKYCCDICQTEANRKMQKERNAAKRQSVKAEADVSSKERTEKDQKTA